MQKNNRLRIVSIVLALLGVADALYLTIVKLTNTKAYCAGSGDCETVASSPYAEIAGIPIAVLGLGAYVAILALLLLESRGSFWKEYGPLAVFGLTLVGVIYSAYLTYLELEVIHAICPYCVVSAVLMVLLFVTAVFRVLQGPTEVKFVERGG